MKISNECTTNLGINNLSSKKIPVQIGLNKTAEELISKVVCPMQLGILNKSMETIL